MKKTALKKILKSWLKLTFLVIIISGTLRLAIELGMGG